MPDSTERATTRAPERTTATRALRDLGGVLSAVLWLLSGCGSGEPAPPLPQAGTEGATVSVPAEETQDPSGFIVWESNRSGRWRLWASDLEGGELRQLTPDERGRRHCCPHIAPGGRKIAYLSLSSGRNKYLDRDAVGELRLISPWGSDHQTLADSARTYFEHRAAVWVDDTQLHYIDREGAVRRVNTVTGESDEILRPTGDLARRWLVDAAGRWAASGRGALAPVVDGGLGPETLLPGCQPYFSHDGRWGFWTAGAGGPIDRFDLASGETATVLRKNDPRLPVDRGYLYFPMLSRDSSLLAFAASDGEHDHHRADYDIFVAEVDREMLELTGVPRAVAPHPAVDRFPDLWRPTDAAPANDRQVARPSGRPKLGSAWPIASDSLVWVWSAAGEGPTTELRRDGRPVDPRRSLDLALGPVVASDSARLLHSGLYRTNQFSLELVLTPPRRTGVALGVIAALSRDTSRENLVLGQRGDRLVLRMRVGPKGRDAFAEADLGPLTPARRLHLVVTYSPGRLTVFRDGKDVLSSRDLLGHFFHWKPYALTLGDRGRGGAEWTGRIEVLAIYDWPLDASEVRPSAGLLSVGARLP